MSDNKPNTAADGTSPANQPSHSAKGGNGSRFLALFLLGLVVGAFGAAYLMRMWLGGPDTYPRAMMQVIGAQAGQLKTNVAQNRCNATDTLPHLQTMRALSNHLEPAFGNLRDDPRFIEHASDMRARLDAALSSPPLNCAGVVAMQESIGQACDACHQDFR